MVNENMLSRRTLLRTAALGSAALAAGVVQVRAASPARLRPENPDEALTRLMDGNARFVSGEAEAPRRSLDRVRELSSGQQPYAAILGCADSRVPVEILFDEGFGDLFTVRVADMTAFFNAEAVEGGSGKVGYLVEFSETERIFNAPGQQATQDYVSGRFG